MVHSSSMRYAVAAVTITTVAFVLVAVERLTIIPTAVVRKHKIEHLTIAVQLHSTIHTSYEYNIDLRSGVAPSSRRSKPRFRAISNAVDDDDDDVDDIILLLGEMERRDAEER